MQEIPPDLMTRPDKRFTITCNQCQSDDVVIVVDYDVIDESVTLGLRCGKCKTTWTEKSDGFWTADRRRDE